MRLIIHRGANQIGGSVVEVSSKSTKIILDCGLNLPTLGEKTDKNKKNGDFDLVGLTEDVKSYDAVLITHYHSDHWGNLRRTLPDIDVYGSDDTKFIISLLSDFLDFHLPPIKTLEPFRELKIGDLKITPFPVKHSAEGAFMYLVEGEGKKLLYTGDFNYVDESIYDLIGEIDVLLCEGVNINIEGENSEDYVRIKAMDIMRETPNHVFVACSSTNINRIKSVSDAAIAVNRKLAVDPFMKAVADRFLPDFSNRQDVVGFLPHPYLPENSKTYPYFSKINDDRRKNRDVIFFESNKYTSMKKNLVFFIRATHSKFLKKLNKIKSLAGSSLIYSKWKNYAKYGVDKEFIDLCNNLGFKIHYLHVSGHAYKDYLKSFVQKVKPKVLIPIHTQDPESFKWIYEDVKKIDDNEPYSF
jgi:ribonuclease J